MKTTRISSFIIACLFFSIGSLTAQEKLIIKTKQDIKLLQVKNMANGNLSNIPTWNKSGGGFLLSISDLDNTAIVANKFMEIQLFNLKTKSTTSWIQLMQGQEMSLSDCFDIYEKGTVDKGDEMASVSDFFGSTFSGYTVSGTNMVVRGAFSFSFDNPQASFLKAEDIDLEWKSKKQIEKIYLNNINSGKLVWMTTNFTGQKFDYNILKAQLGDKISDLLKIGQKYEVLFYIKGEKEPVSHTFRLSPAFYNRDNKNSFLSWDNIQISWQTNSIPDYAWIEDETGNAVWEAEKYSNKSINFKLIKDNMDNFDAGKYKLVLEYNKIQAAFKFEIFASPQEVAKLKQFVNE